MNDDLKINQFRFCAIDFESAGARRGETDAPVQIGMALWSPADGYLEHFVSYLASPRPIAWTARRVHGIRDADIADAPSLLELWPTVNRFLNGSVVVAHGMGTEKRFLRTFPGNAFGPWVDTLILGRAIYPHLDNHSLSRLCDSLKLSEGVSQRHAEGRWHDALFDAYGSLAILEHVVRKFSLEDQDLQLLLRPKLSVWSSLRGS